jgi:hypothetical protein
VVFAKRGTRTGSAIAQPVRPHAGAILLLRYVVVEIPNVILSASGRCNPFDDQLVLVQTVPIGAVVEGASAVVDGGK